MFVTSLRARSRVVGLIAAAGGLLAVMGSAQAAAAGPCGTNGVFSQTGASATCTYATPGTEDTFTVPDGISSVSVSAVGASGGLGSLDAQPGGHGASVSNAALPVTAGDELWVDVGGIGADGNIGNCINVSAPGGFPDGGNAPRCSGGGGGSSALLIAAREGATLTGNVATDSRLLVAAGGGGGGQNYPGGGAGVSTQAGAGDGGCVSPGGPGGVGPTDGTDGGGAGGCADQSDSCAGGPGTAATGGVGAMFCTFGGGGGGGWFGGGGGGGLGFGGASGGGGGSSYGGAGESAGITIATAASGQAPQVTISYAVQADVVLAMTAPPTGTAGSTISYDVTFQNNGPDSAQDVKLSDVVPDGATFVSASQTSGPAATCTTPPAGGTGTVQCSLAELAAAASAGFTIVLRSSPSADDGSALVNTATVSTTTPDTDATNDSATSSTTLGVSADLSVTSTAPPKGNAGEAVSYSVTVANAGPSDAADVILSIPLPAGTTFVSARQTSGPPFTCTTPAAGGTGKVDCTIDRLAAGASAAFTLVVRTGAGATSGGGVATKPSVSSSTPDGDAADNSATASTTLAAAADVSVTKTVAVGAVEVGDTVGYDITVANAGPSDAASVVLSDPLPAGTTFVSVTQVRGPAFTCTAPAAGQSGTVRCTIPALAAGASAVLHVAIMAGGTAVLQTALSNTATVSTSTPDANAANNSATATSPTLAARVRAKVKARPRRVRAGEKVRFRLVVRAREATAHDVSVCARRPAGLALVSARRAQIHKRRACWTIDTLAAGKARTFKLVARVRHGARGRLKMRVVVTGNGIRKTRVSAGVRSSRR